MNDIRAIAEAYLNDKLSESFLVSLVESGVIDFSELDAELDKISEGLRFSGDGMDMMDQRSGSVQDGYPEPMNSEGKELAKKALDQFVVKASTKALDNNKSVKEKEDVTSKLLTAKMLTDKLPADK